MGSEEVTRESVLKLMERKDEIEKQLQQLKQVLDGNGVGMNDSLVDSDGYPRQDIDVYQVRHARHNIICLQNDHKDVMTKIEQGLHALHSQVCGIVPESSQGFPKNVEANSLPIAKVSYVESGSPAEMAGLKVDDLIISFGTVRHENFKCLNDIGELTRHSVGRHVPVIVRRRTGEVEKLTLIPSEWKGKGLLGCNILPLPNINR